MSDVNEMDHIITPVWIADTFQRIAAAARVNPELAAAARKAILDSNLLDIFGAGEGFNPVDILDAGGVDALRAQLAKFDLATLRAIVRAHNYDPDKESARWRSAPRFIELIIEKAKVQLEQEIKTGAATKSLSEAAWML